MALLVVADRPLVPLDGYTAVLAGRERTALAPLGRPLTHQLAAAGVDTPALLVAGQGWRRGDEAGLEAAEQQGLTTQVLNVEGGGGHQPRTRCL